MEYPSPEREAVERTLLEALDAAQTAYQEAKPDERQAARLRYLEVLRAFSDFVKVGD